MIKTNIFSDDLKIKSFDKIIKYYYSIPFASMSKSDIDLLMFSIYLDALKSQGDVDGCSDYYLSKNFGISQKRVRNLKERKELVYPSYDNWEEELPKHLKKVKLDDKTKQLKILIDDVTLLNEFKNYIEDKNCFCDFSLTNSNILNIDFDDFLKVYTDDVSLLFNDNFKKYIKNKESGFEKIKELSKELTSESIKDIIKIIGKESCIFLLESINNKHNSRFVSCVIENLKQ